MRRPFKRAAIVPTLPTTGGRRRSAARVTARARPKHQPQSLPNFEAGGRAGNRAFVLVIAGGPARARPSSGSFVNQSQSGGRPRAPLFGQVSVVASRTGSTRRASFQVMMMVSVRMTCIGTLGLLDPAGPLPQATGGCCSHVALPLQFCLELRVTSGDLGVVLLQVTLLGRLGGLRNLVRSEPRQRILVAIYADCRRFRIRTTKLCGSVC